MGVKNRLSSFFPLIAYRIAAISDYERRNRKVKFVSKLHKRLSNFSELELLELGYVYSIDTGADHNAWGAKLCGP